MDGVNVLNTVVQRPEESGSYISLYVMLGIALVGLAIACTFALVSYCKDKQWGDWQDVVGAIILIIVFVGCCFGTYRLIGAIKEEIPRRETIVYATIEDSVPWKKLHERYDLVRVDGKIYQLRVKEGTDNGTR